MWRTILAVLIGLSSSESLHATNPKLAYWNQQRRGANGDGGVDSDSWFAAAASSGIEFVRLSPAIWKGTGRDFLLGDADRFEGIPPEDLHRLNSVLDIAQRHGVRIVLTMFSLPGSRWRQHNDGKFDYGLWTDSSQQEQALRFCADLARELKDHPALVGYNLLNEPHPERADGFQHVGEGFDEWTRDHEGTLADFNLFNRRMIAAIRSVDSLTPIILDGCFHASPEGFGFLNTVPDSTVLYAFHFYEPWEYVTFRANNGQYCYPDSMPDDSTTATTSWSSEELQERMLPVHNWVRATSTPANRIIVGEFGCDRRVCGAQAYLEDLMTVFDDEGWHWAFYSFRASDWDGLDYELGTEKLGWKYWQAIDSGASHEDIVNRHDNSLWHVISSRLKPRKAR
jgi:hypothetical protein